MLSSELWEDISYCRRFGAKKNIMAIIPVLKNLTHIIASGEMQGAAGINRRGEL